jgi:hypothetical protein
MSNKRLKKKPKKPKFKSEPITNIIHTGYADKCITRVVKTRGGNKTSSGSTYSSDIAQGKVSS